jgi:ligand-binding sensor domain-containing protein
MRRVSAVFAVAAGIAAMLACAAAGRAGEAGTVSTEARWESLAETAFDHLDQKSGLIHDYVTAIGEDGEGFLWVGTEGGLARYDGYRFRAYKRTPDAVDTIPDNFILALHVDPAGRLWVGTQTGLARYDAENDRFVRYETGPGQLSNAEITAIADDGQNALWIGTWGGLNRLDPATGIVHVLRHTGADPASLPDDQIRSLLTDHTGQLWIGTNTGLVRRNQDGSGFAPYPVADAAAAKALADSIKSLFEDEHGRIWVGTFRSGAVLIDPATGKARVVPEAPGPDQQFRRDPAGCRLARHRRGRYRVDRRPDRACAAPPP